MQSRGTSDILMCSSPVKRVCFSEEFRAKYSAFLPGVTGHPFATWHRDAFAFIHIPKTGGSTFK